jgi:hypothetical protein
MSLRTLSIDSLADIAITLALALTTAHCTGTAHADRMAASAGAASCPSAEPANGSACALPAGDACNFTVRASRTVHCHCMGQVWDCGTPLGIDVPTSATCPSSQPASGSACTLPSTANDPGGNRPGCFYDVAMTTNHQCVCAHAASAPANGRWDCGPVPTPIPADPRGCPARTPADNTLCTVAHGVDCQYGFNLSTTCRCNAISPSDPRSAWRCHTSPMPPAPSR